MKHEYYVVYMAKYKHFAEIHESTSAVQIQYDEPIGDIMDFTSWLLKGLLKEENSLPLTDILILNIIPLPI